MLWISAYEIVLVAPYSNSFVVGQVQCCPFCRLGGKTRTPRNVPTPDGISTSHVTATTAEAHQIRTQCLNKRACITIYQLKLVLANSNSSISRNPSEIACESPSQHPEARNHVNRPSVYWSVLHLPLSCQKQYTAWPLNFPVASSVHYSLLSYSLVLVHSRAGRLRSNMTSI
jgi:hypothetical protein